MVLCVFVGELLGEMSVSVVGKKVSKAMIHFYVHL